MNKSWILIGMGITAMLCGCRQTAISGVPGSEEELAWERVIRRNYPGYKAPGYAARAEYDNTLDRRSAVISDPLRPVADPVEICTDPVDKVAAGDDPSAIVDRAVDVPVQPMENSSAAEADVKETAAETDAEADKAPAAAEKKEADKGKIDPPDPSASNIYVVKSGDTLGGIALKAYGSARYSNLILKANSDIIRNPNLLKPGMRLMIPKL